MKKIGIILIAILLLTGCTNEREKQTTNIDKKVVEHENLIVQEDRKPTTEEELSEYIEVINNEVTLLTQKEELTSSEQNTLKNTFITLTDFIFYNGRINGQTFSELTEEVKKEIITLYEQIDAKIEKKYPGYKEEIKENAERTYNDIKEKLTTLKEEVINNYKEDVGEEKYNEQVQEYETKKEEVKEIVTPIIDEIVEAGKEIYETSKNSFDKWYQEWKEE